MIHAYYGDGKGKSTAAAGMALRAAGNHMRVMFVQFMKTENSGERVALQRFDNVTLSSCPLELKYTYNMDEHERQQVSVMFRGIFDRSVSMTLSDRYDMIILDEVFDVIHEGMLAGSAVFEFISNAPNSLEIVMTGRKPPQRFIDAADYVTEFKKIKHPFDHGVAARIGIEF
ncbi:MAG: cob(I)yrinic acid a,c-diamide adenosyltransferase [Ruminococcus sp.]|nr:cob(I)yrinic acid a,c-diamide adenosyltransferase [Ruminococcus sp.]